jgi:hypothetical protein
LRINLVFSHEKNGKAVPVDNEAVPIIVEKPDPSSEFKAESEFRS